VELYKRLLKISGVFFLLLICK